MALNLDILIPAENTVSGPCLALTAPISFWGGVDPRSGEIIDARHPQRGRNIAGTILALPGTIGSSSASAVLLELVHAERAPAALLMNEPDAILLLGVIVAREMGWPALPAFRLAAMRQQALDGRRVQLTRDGALSTDDENQGES